MDPRGLAERLRRISAIGPYFEVRTGADAGWRPLSELLNDQAALAARVNVVRDALAMATSSEDLDERACASTSFLALASRLVAPVLAGAALDGVVLTPEPHHVWWQPVAGGPIPMAWTSADARQAATPADAGTLIAGGVVAGVVTALAAQFERAFHISEQVLWGNVASAFAGAATMIIRSGVPVTMNPRDVLDAALAHDPLTGSGAYVTPVPGRPERVFVRNNCCLFYRIPNGGTCGDCVLVSAEAREALWRDELDRGE